jgi:Pyridine nucleotide-disulphide oxidoreductase
MRTVENSTCLQKRVGEGGKAVVVGSGFIGCEAAASLALRGAAVTLASHEQSPQRTRLGHEVGQRIEGWLQDLGVNLRLGVGIGGIERTDGGFAVNLDDGDSLDTGTVIFAAPDWLAAQFRAVSEGARAIGGHIEVADDCSLPESVWRRHAEKGRLRHQRLLSDPNPPSETQHWQFSGASMALTAAVYTQVGSLEPLTTLEDEHLERALRHHHIPIHRLLSVRVTTSPRLDGRATRGLSYDLARIALSLHEERAEG